MGLGKLLQRNNTVYLIRSANLVKIGISNDVEKRMKGLYGNSPTPMELVDAFGPFSDKDAYKIERYMHKLYKDKNDHGEWFRINDDDVSNICNTLSQYI